MNEQGITEFKRGHAPLFYLVPLPLRERGIQGDGAPTIEQRVKQVKNVKDLPIISCLNITN